MQSAIVTRTIQDAVKLLNATGVKYKIIDHDGKEYGTLEVAQPKIQIRKRKSHREYGSMSSHFKDYIASLKVGDVAAIPLGQFAKEKEALRGAVAAYCNTHWGLGSYKSCITDKYVEILRIA